MDRHSSSKEANTQKNGFYKKFYTQPGPESVVYEDKYTYKPTQGNRKGKIISNYSELVGKYYKVSSITSDVSRVGDKIYWVELIGDDNLPFYFKAEDENAWSHNDFVTLGYYKKVKQTFVGKEFYSTGRYELDKVDAKEKVTLPFKVKFKCIDIAANIGEDGYIFAVLENEKYGKIKGVIDDGYKLEHFISISKYNEFVKKYGAKFGSCVAEGKIEFGMNKKMVLDAWRSPDHVNTTRGSFGVHEQWVYGNQYLYLKMEY